MENINRLGVREEVFRPFRQDRNAFNMQINHADRREIYTYQRHFSNGTGRASQSVPAPRPFILAFSDGTEKIDNTLKRSACKSTFGRQVCDILFSVTIED
uniref:Uncharacterized protein n=1 Tax=Romanomermis culicivorax TaxID=13658 RepID=A0A915INB7_ROMCU